MSVIKFNHSEERKIVFCLVDTLDLCQDNFAKELIKNQSDYVISNLASKRFSIYQSKHEDQLLQIAALDGYEYAVVFSTGTEFINGSLFFKKLKELLDTDFFICGHILDREDAYYELHHQCYVINLKKFVETAMPEIGKYEWNCSHEQIAPNRSLENYHDSYTPVSIQSGKNKKQYNHKCHGWHVLKTAFEYNYTVLIFDQDFRSSKRHHYPESRVDFLKSLKWIYFRETECAYNFVHTANTELEKNNNTRYEQIIIPASGLLYTDLIDAGNIIVYDYNQKSLDYWKNNLPKKDGIEYTFVKTDLLVEHDLINFIKPNKKTLINLSNIFAYEGTTALRPLYYRLQKENELITLLQSKILDIDIMYSIRAATGFANIPQTGNYKVIKPVPIEELTRPTWHGDDDWSTRPLQY